MLNIKNIKFEYKEDFYRIVDVVVQVENSPIILLSTSEAAREFFIQELTAALLEKYNIQLHNTTPDKILNNFINSVLERDFGFLKWKEFLNKGQALCIDGLEFFKNKTSIQNELWFFLRDFNKPLILGLREELPKENNLFIPQLRELVECGKVIKLELRNKVLSVKEIDNPKNL